MYQYKSDKDSTISIKKNFMRKNKSLKNMLNEVRKGEVALDDLYLRKIRKKIKADPYSAVDYFDIYKIDNQKMILGTMITVIGWAMLNACGSGRHNINSVTGRQAAELAFLNTFLAGSFSSFISLLLKRYIVRKDNEKT